MSTLMQRRPRGQRRLRGPSARRFTSMPRPKLENLESRELMDVGLSADWWRNTACQVPPEPVLASDPGDVGLAENGPTVYLTPGWATFGQVLPRGLAYEAVQVGNLATQTDVKVRWEDGSIRFAVVTTHVEDEGSYALAPASAPVDDFEPAPSDGTVWFDTPRTGEYYWVAQQLVSAPQGRWLDGPLVVEERFAAPVYYYRSAPNQVYYEYAHSLTVIYDVRTYRDGARRVDITVENTNDREGDRVGYDLYAFDGDGVLLVYQPNVSHPYLTRYRQTVSLGLSESQVTPDFEPAYQAEALPRYLPIVANEVREPAGPDFGILGRGSLDPYMPAHGGRPEIAPYPDWTARYLVHQHPTQGRYVRAHGDLAGSWPVHIRNPDFSMVSIDQRPNYWLDPRATTQNRPLGNLGGRGPLTPDNAHQPSLAYVPYLMTGDRYYADEMAFWANYVLLSTWQDDYYNARRGSEGRLEPNEVRGIAWGLRNLVDAAAYLPDDDPMKGYLGNKVQNNLRWLDNYANSVNNPLGVLWQYKRLENTNPSMNDRAWIALWEQNYLAWAIDHANKQGFVGGLDHRNKIVRLQISLFNDAAVRNGAAPYILPVGVQTPRGSGNVQWYTDVRQTYQGATQFAGYYGVDARLSLMTGVENNMAGAQAAFDYLDPQVCEQQYFNGLSDLAIRAGWAITPVGMA